MSVHLLTGTNLVLAILFVLAAQTLSVVKAWIAYQMLAKAIEDARPDQRPEIIRALRHPEISSTDRRIRDSVGDESVDANTQKFLSIARFLRRSLRNDASSGS